MGAGRSVVTRLHLDPSGYLAGLKTAAAGTKDMVRNFDDAAKKQSRGFREMSQGMAVAGGLMLAGFGVAAGAAMKFDKAMSAVQAASKATGKDFQALREAALQAGKTTSFSATEAAKAQEELAKAGVSVKDILGGGLKGALDLAAAGELDVAEAAEVASIAMNQFGQSGDKVPHVADLIANAANKASGSAHQIGFALRQGGLVASQFGISIEETVGALAAFAKAGLLGSDAGTSLKTMLLHLGNPTGKSAKLMQELGINAYDAAGNFVGLTGIADELQTALGGLTQAQRDQALGQLFGSDAVRGANVLYQQGAAGIRRWTEEVSESGAAMDTANTKLDNLAGDLKKLKGTLNAALIETGESSTGSLRVLTQATKSMVDGFLAVPAPMQAALSITTLITGAALAAAGAYGIMAPKIASASAALVGLGAAGRMANTVLTKTAKWGGILFASMAITQIAFAAAGKSASLAGNQMDGFSKSLVAWGLSGKAGIETTTAFRENMKMLDYDLGTLNSGNWAGIGKGIGGAVEGLTGLGAAFDDSLEHARERMADWDKALTALANNGHAEEAAHSFDRIAEKARKQDISLAELRKGLPEYTAAVENAAAASKDAATGLGEGGKQAKIMAGGMSEAIKEAGSLADVLKGLNDVAMGGFDAQNAYQIGLNNLTKSLKDNKSAFNGTKTAAVENRQAIGDQIKLAQDYIAHQYDVVKATHDEATANAWVGTTYKTLRAQIINAATAAGINKTAVAALVDQLFQVPPNTPAAVSAPGAVEAKEAIKGVKAAADALPAAKAPKISAPGSVNVKLALSELKVGLDRLTDKVIGMKTRGVPVTAADLNSLKAKAEALERTYAVKVRVDGGSAAAASLNAVKAAAERAERVYSITTVHNEVYAAKNKPRRWGGITRTAAAGSLREAQVAGPGTRYQWAEPATGGEAFVPRRGDPARSKAILAEAASWYGGQVAFGGGASMAGAMHSRGGGTTVINNFHLHQTVAPGGDLRKAGQYFVECIQEYENRGGRSWRTRSP